MLIPLAIIAGRGTKSVWHYGN